MQTRRPTPAAIGAGANLLRPGGRGRDREPVRERGGLEVAHERSKTRAEEVDGRRVREKLPTGAAAQVPVDQVLVAPQRSVRHELHRVREQRRELFNVACERFRRDLNSRADPADLIERRLNRVPVNAEAVQAHEVDSTGETIRIEHSLRLAVGYKFHHLYHEAITRLERVSMEAYLSTCRL